MGAVGAAEIVHTRVLLLKTMVVAAENVHIAGFLNDPAKNNGSHHWLRQQMSRPKFMKTCNLLMHGPLTIPSRPSK